MVCVFILSFMADYHWHIRFLYVIHIFYYNMPVHKKLVVWNELA